MVNYQLQHFRLENKPGCVKNNDKAMRWRICALDNWPGENERKKIYPVDGNSARRRLSL
jgi:hypothetical protein